MVLLSNYFYWIVKFLASWLLFDLFIFVFGHLAYLKPSMLWGIRKSVIFLIYLFLFIYLPACLSVCLSIPK